MTFDPELPKRTSDKVIAVFPDIAGHSPTAMGRELYEVEERHA
jgi:hypothetical protein